MPLTAPHGVTKPSEVPAIEQCHWEQALHMLISEATEHRLWVVGRWGAIPGVAQALEAPMAPLSKFLAQKLWPTSRILRDPSDPPPQPRGLPQAPQ